MRNLTNQIATKMSTTKSVLVRDTSSFRSPDEVSGRGPTESLLDFTALTSVEFMLVINEQVGESAPIYTTIYFVLAHLIAFFICVIGEAAPFFKSVSR